VEVVLADIPTMPGFEHHTFRCSACPQVARRLVICRAKMPIPDPPAPAHLGPVIQPEMGQARKRVAGCGRETQQQTDGSRGTKGPDWEPAVKKLSRPSKTEQWQRGPRLGQRRSRSSAADRWLLRSARQLRAPPPRSAGFGRLKASAVSTSPGVAAVSIRIIEVRRPRHPLELRATFLGRENFLDSGFPTARRR
jgi:hypothetical protein